MEPGREVKPQADSRLRVRLMSLEPQRRLSMAPVTIARFVQELEKLKQVSDAEKLKPQEYDSRLARIIQELREKGIDADRAATTAALADAVKRGIITLPVQAHLQRRLGLTQTPWKYCSSPATSNTSLQCRQRSEARRSVRGTRSRQLGQTPYSLTPGKRAGFLGRGTTDQRCGGLLVMSRSGRATSTASPSTSRRASCGP